MRIPTALACLALLSACGGGHSTATVSAPQPSRSAATATPSPIPTHTNVPVPPTQTGPHFATPQAAMRYLSSAWNRNDITALKHVTDPLARDELQLMHDEAADLKLDHCTFTKARGDYQCFFTHGFPPGYKHKYPLGKAEFTVGPADKPGWYMTFFESCGDGDGT